MLSIRLGLSRPNARRSDVDIQTRFGIAVVSGQPSKVTLPCSDACRHLMADCATLGIMWSQTSQDSSATAPEIRGISGAASENRTPDLLITSETLQTATPPETLTSGRPIVTDVSDPVSNPGESVTFSFPPEVSDGARTRLWGTMRQGAEQETPVFTGTPEQSLPVQSDSIPLAVPSGAIQSHSDVYLADAEQTLRMNEALDAGMHVAEWCMGDEVIRSYGRTPDEARARLLAYIESEIWLIDPAVAAHQG